MRRIKSLMYSLILVVAGIAVIVLSAKDIKTAKADPIDLNDASVNWNELEVGDHVEMDVDFLMDYFVTTEKDGKETDRVYAMPHINDEGEYFTFDNFIGIAAKPDNFSDLDHLVDQSLEWWTSDEIELNSTPVHIEGKVAKLDKEKLGFFDEYLDDLDIVDSSVKEASMYEYYIVPIQNNSPVLIIVGALMILGGLAWGGFTIVKSRG